MPKGKSDRREFLTRTSQGAGAAGAAALVFPSGGKAKEEKPRKKVINRPGQKSTPETILSPGIQYGRLLFISGAGAHDPQTHQVVEGPISNQVRQCLENLKSVLEAAGSSLDHVLKCTVFLTDISNFQEMNKVYHTFFPADPPARTTVAVKELPANSPVEIECFAYVD
jgi:2-iminobutanoate/2-iminopropanoate deaminase